MEITSIKLTSDGYLVNGTTFVPKDYNGWMHEFIDEWLKTNAPETEFTQDDIIKDMVARYTNLVDRHIQAVVDTHNTVARTAYANVKSAEAYSKTPEHWDVAWCQDVWSFNVKVWNFVRVELLPTFDFTRVLTDDEFIAMLPKYEGVE